MINSTSFAPSMGTTSPIQANKQKAVYINGKSYPVIKVPDNRVCSFAPMYKEVAIIDGKAYNLKEVPSLVSSDATKEVVYVDGKRYDVQDQSTVMLRQFGDEVGKLIGNAFNKASAESGENLNTFA